MTRFVISIAMLLACSNLVTAQTTTEQRAADWARWGVAAVAIAADAAECPHSTAKTRCWVTLGVRQGVIQGASIGLAKWFPRLRPCAPNCGIDNPLDDVPSRHTGATAATLPPLSQGVGARFVVAVSATTLVAILSKKATKHDTIGVLTGAAVGYAASFIR